MGTDSQLDICLASANTLFAGAMAERLAAQPKIRDATQVALSSFLEESATMQFDVLLLHLEGSAADTAEFTKTMVRKAGENPVVVLGADHDPESVVAHIENGAIAYVPTSTRFEELVQAIHDIHAGKPQGSSEVIAAALDRIRQLLRNSAQALMPKVELSAREREVLVLVGKGLPNKQIAGQLNLSTSTVKHDLRKIFDKLQARTRSEAVLRARQFDLIHDSLSLT